MTELDNISRVLGDAGWFKKVGPHVIVDGQFGSTGKGVAASILERVHATIDGGMLLSETNAGPNSGHTAVFSGHKMMTQQIPVSAVQRRWLGKPPTAYLNGGAVIDILILKQEIEKFNMHYKVYVNPFAPVITDKDVENEANGGPAKIAGTGKGVGSAIARKVMREGVVAKDMSAELLAIGADLWDRRAPSARDYPAIMEVAQGFSLGSNQGFYPHCTSRECTVGQALSDAGIHPSRLQKTMMCVRTYPIRVGNTAMGNSGGMYLDQRETSWEELGQTPELTTVTKRVRRVFTWSNIQFSQALEVNRPDVIFLNFCNYLKDPEAFLDNLRRVYRGIMRRDPEAIITGWGPETEQAKLWPI